MTALASSDITTTVLDRRRNGRDRVSLVSLTFGDGSLTYPALGVPMPSASTLGMLTMQTARVLSDHSNSGLKWEWDYTNNTLRARRFGHIPVIIDSEAVTLTSHAGTLKYPPAYIISAVGTISGTVTPLRPCPTGVTLAASQFTVNWTTGAVVCRTADSVTAMAVTYIPQQPTGPFSAANLVADEEITLATGGVNTAFRAATMQYCYQTTATAQRLPFNNQTAASNRPKLDINASGNTTFTAHADNDAKVAKVTYLKYSGFANNVGVTFIDQAAISLTSEAKEWGKTAGDRVAGLMIPGFGGQVTGKETTNYLQIYLGNATATPAVAIASFDLTTQVLTTAESAAQTTLEDTPFLFLSNFYQPPASWSELTVNDAPASTTLVMEIIG